MADQGRDAGRTSGGGNLGHDQPQDVSESTDIRNAPPERRPDSSAKDRQAGRLSSDPVMPEDDETLTTKI